MSIKVLSKDDGLWLSFHCEKTGKSALLNVEAFANGYRIPYGSITAAAIKDTCQEMADIEQLTKRKELNNG